MHFEQIMSHIRREVIRTMRKFHQQPRIGLVSSYNKQLHAVKVLFQPSGTESGWIPLTSIAVGNQFGILSAPNMRDEVEIHFQEGEHMVARVMTRHFNKLDKAPQIDPGEHIIVHGTGSGHYFKKDGTLQHVGPQYFKTGQQQSGVSGNTSTGGQTGNTNQQVPQQQQQQQQNAGKQSFIFNPDGSSTLNVPDPNAQGQGTPKNPQHTATVKKNITHISQQGNIVHTAQGGSITNTAQQNITETAQQGSFSRSAATQIVDSAPTINHNGNTNIAGTLGVSGAMTASGGAQFGAASFNINTSGHFTATSGGSVGGGFGTDVPVTVTAATHTVASTETSLIFNTTSTCTLTLPSPSSLPGQWLYLKNIASQAINSASSNVVPLGSATAGSAILISTSGKWAWLQSDGTNWITMAGN